MALLQLNNHLARSVLRYQAAYQHLAKADPVMGRLIAQIGECTLRPRRNYFAVLCDAIIAQQLSTAVADVIYRRFQKLFPSYRPSPQAVLRISLKQLQTVGLSRQKVSYLQDLARGFVSGHIVPSRLWRQSDEDVIASLVEIRGIGRWTAEMFLIFSLNRLDVLPGEDLGIRKAIQQWYGLRELPPPRAVQTIGRRWEPYRTIAAWYLWSSLH